MVRLCAFTCLCATLVAMVAGCDRGAVKIAAPEMPDLHVAHPFQGWRRLPTRLHSPGTRRPAPHHRRGGQAVFARLKLALRSTAP